MKKKQLSPLIFVVEDDRMYQNIIKYHLKSKNYDHFEIYGTGEDCILNLNKNPQIILLDYMLGETNGLDVLKQIKEYSNDIQVILLTGNKELDIAISSMKQGAFDYVVKDSNTFKKLDDQIQGAISLNREIVNRKIKKRRTRIIKWSIIAAIIISIGLALYISGIWSLMVSFYKIWFY